MKHLGKSPIRRRPSAHFNCTLRTRLPIRATLAVAQFLRRELRDAQGFRGTSEESTSAREEGVERGLLYSVWRDRAPMKHPQRDLVLVSSGGQKRMSIAGRKSTPDQSIELLSGGTQAFPRMIEAINAARRRIHLEIYGFYRGSVGSRFLEALTNAARRGVRVRVVLDGWGSRFDSGYIQKVLSRAGCEVEIYNPFWSSIAGRMWRNHRKILLVDDEAAWIGGINIGDDYAAAKARTEWIDLAVEIRGLACSQLVEQVWGEKRWAPIRGIRILLSELQGGGRLRKRYLRAIRSARERLYLVQAYFLPDRRLLRSLIAASRRGIKVVLLLAGRSDVPLSRAATTWRYQELLNAGVRIFECRRSILHAKVLTIDGQRLLTGSFNLDPFSLVNLEVLADVTDPLLVAKADEWITSQLASSNEVQREACARSRLSRWLHNAIGLLILNLANRFARLLAPHHIEPSGTKES